MPNKLITCCYDWRAYTLLEIPEEKYLVISVNQCMAYNILNTEYVPNGIGDCLAMKAILRYPYCYQSYSWRLPSIT